MENFIQPEILTITLARIVAFATAIPIHESAHAYISDKLGDPTARNLGRLTLNPLKHIDFLGLIALLLIGFGWAKPVPINPNYYKSRKYGMAITAAAGPISNLLLAYLTMILYKTAHYLALFRFGGTLPYWAWTILYILFALVQINITLAIFNMLPFPPFDGSRIFALILPEKWYFAVQRYERYIMFAVLALLWMGSFSGILAGLTGSFLSGMDWATGYIDMVMRSLNLF